MYSRIYCKIRTISSVVKIPVIFVWVILPVLFGFFGNWVIFVKTSQLVIKSSKKSKNINCMYSATLKIYTFDRNLKKFTL
jgi:hypothetical protein